jgi:hypothetical protein
MDKITPQEAKQIAEEAYIFAFSMLENYKTMYIQAVNENLPSFQAPFNHFFHMRQLLGPEFTEVVGPNNDTLYSMAWLDLGTEPIVLGLPDFPDERYYVIQIVDMYTFNVEYIGARTTGYQRCCSSHRRAIPVFTRTHGRCRGSGCARGQRLARSIYPDALERPLGAA